MLLTYQVFPSDGRVFFLPAANDEEATAFAKEYLEQNDAHYAHIAVWNPETKRHNLRSFRIEIEEAPQQREKEFKIETRYVKWVKVSAFLKEDEFDRAAIKAINTFDTLPEQLGWTRSFVIKRLGHSDDRDDQISDDQVEKLQL